MTRLMGKYLGIVRSLLMYRGVPLRARRLQCFYARFVPHGSVCFDIGAHVGNHVQAWRALGARVVAVEPQADFVRLLRRLYGRDNGVTIVNAAVGASESTATLLVSERTPTVSTLSRDWTRAVQQDPSFRRVKWRPGSTVHVTTLQALRHAYGVPAFVKIDVEGYEAEVLRGLDTALPCLSFEYLPAAKQVVFDCLERLTKLGDYRYNWSAGETHRLARARWCDADEVRRFVDNLSLRDGSGDIYARLAFTVKV